jgi:hypothetical protein
MKQICQCALSSEIHLIEYPPKHLENGQLSCCEICEGGEEFNEENTQKAFQFLNERIDSLVNTLKEYVK